MFLLMMFSVETISLGGGVDSAEFAADYGIAGFVDGIFCGVDGWLGMAGACGVGEGVWVFEVGFAGLV